MLCIISIFVFFGCDLYTGNSLSTRIDDLLAAGKTDPDTPAEPAGPFSCSAGADINAAPLGKLTLNGTVSNLAGTGVTYSWSASAANPSVISLVNPDTNSPSFDITPTTVEGNYTFTLTANDGSTEVSDDIIVAVDYLTKLTLGSSSGFGKSVAISSDGSTALVGDQYDDKAFIYTKEGTGWSLKKTLTPSIGEHSSFGESLALSSDGTTAIIGALANNTKANQAGAAFVYSGTAWDTENILYADDAAAFDSFGASVSISADGTTVLIGSSNDSWLDPSDTKVSYAGSAYIFSNAGGSWAQTAKLTDSDGKDNHGFGGRVCLSADGRTALITALNGGSAVGTGQAFIYNYSDTSGTWLQTKLCSDSDAIGSENFGWSVSLSADGRTALIGAHGNDDNADNDPSTTDYMGAAYIYTYSETAGDWSRLKKLTASDRAKGGDFGLSVSLSADGSKALIGSLDKTMDDTSFEFTGNSKVYIYSGPDYTTETIIASDAPEWTPRYNAGESVSISGDGTTFIVGAPGDSIMLTTSSVYCFNIEL